MSDAHRRRATPSGLLQITERQRVGDYEVVASLGRGGSSEVFVGLSLTAHGASRRLVVLKLLHPCLQDDRGVLQMFLDEAALSARLRHDNIVPTLDAGTQHDRPYIVMTYLEGLPLDRALGRLRHRGVPVPAEAAALIISETLRGLHYAHELLGEDGSPLHIVHRDVSPSNVFVCWDGTVKLLDFGIAKADSRRTRTDSGVIKGKARYVSPEQVRGGEVDRRADVWAAGVVLAEMLSGRPLFDGENEAAIMRAVTDEPLPHPSALREGLAPELGSVLESALARNVGERFGTAGAMADALDAWLGAAERRFDRADLAAFLGDHFAGEREQQQAMIRASVGGAALSATSTGSFRIPPVPDAGASESSEPRESIPRGPVALGALAIATVVLATWTSLPDVAQDAEVPRPERSSAQTPQPAAPPRVEVAQTVRRAPLATPPSAPPPPSPVETPRVAPAPSIAIEHGYLTLDTAPWAEVWLGGRHLGDTPLMRVELPVGTHRLELRNPERQITTTYDVVIDADEVTTRRIGLM